MRTFKLKELAEQQRSFGCTDMDCGAISCNTEYVLLKDAEEECKTLWTTGNNLRAKLADAELVAKEKSLAVTLLTNQKTIATGKLAETELQLKDKSGALDIVREQRADAWKTNRELRSKLFAADNTVTDLRARLEAAEAQLKYGGSPSFSGAAQFRTRDGSTYQYDPRTKTVQVNSREFEQLHAKASAYRNGDLESTVARLKTELLETQAGILKRDFARYAYYITGDRWNELHNAEREEKKSQQIIDAQATVIRNQKNELQKMAAELVMAKPFFVVSGVKIVPNAFVAPGQIIGLSAPETIIYPFEHHSYTLLRNVADALEVQQGEDIVLVAKAVMHDRKGLSKSLKDERDKNSRQLKAITAAKQALGVNDPFLSSLEENARVMTEQRNSYKAIVREIRKALGFAEEAKGTEIIAYATLLKQVHSRLDTEVEGLRTTTRQQRIALETIGEAATQFVNKPYVANKLFDEAMDLFWTIERTIKNTQPTTGASTAPGSSR